MQTKYKEKSSSHLPKFRKYVNGNRKSSTPPSALPNSYIAYYKGWAHYSAYLGFELGIYENEPLKEVGFLLENIFSSAGMIADIGIHEFGWTKEYKNSEL